MDSLWRPPPIPCEQVKWDLPYKGVAELTVVEGDKVKFTWNTKKATLKHDVFQLTGAASFKNCAVTNKTGTALTKALQKSSFTTKALAPGTYYYTCSVSGHCAAKQKVKVNVVSARAGPLSWSGVRVPSTQLIEWN